MTSAEISTEIATNAPTVFSDNVLASIKSFDDVTAILTDSGVTLETMDDYGTGFHIAEKNSLIGVPMVLLEWRFNDGDFGQFVSVAAVTKHNEKVIFNDGSTGIYDQLRMVTTQRIERKHPAPQAGLLVERGLHKSEYTYKDPKGNDVPASTFYLAE